MTFVILLILAIGLYFYIAGRPDTFRLERSILVNAPPEKIFSKVNDFHSWTDWSPWEKMDLNMKKTYSGKALGKGSTYAWEGSGKVGVGNMEITESVASSKIVLDLNFLRPFRAQNVTELTFTAKDGGTEVVWVMSGSLNFLMKTMHVFMNMDKAVGGDFERGLVNLKELAEK